MVGQRVINRLDFRVGQHRLIGAIGLGNAELGGCRLSRFELARGDGNDLNIPAFQHAGKDFFHADIGG